MAKRRNAARWIAALLLLGIAVALSSWATWPDVAALARRDPGSTAFIERFRQRQRDRGASDRVEWRPVPLARIAPSLRLAVVVAEDIDFFSHHGIATAEMKKAFADAWEDKEMPRGASTLTQQLAKNLWLSPSRNPWRKVKEALLTWDLEHHLGKRRILELYLNVVELGPGVYGAEAASRHWFGKGAAALTAREAAQLAASLPKPSSWHPGSPSKAYQRRVEIVLGRMEKAGGWVGPLVE